MNNIQHMWNKENVINHFNKTKKIKSLIYHLNFLNEGERNDVINYVLHNINCYKKSYDKYQCIVDFLRDKTQYLNSVDNINNNIRWNYFIAHKTKKIECKKCKRLCRYYNYFPFCGKQCKEAYVEFNTIEDVYNYIKDKYNSKRGGFSITYLYKHNVFFKQSIDKLFENIINITHKDINFTVLQKCYHILNKLTEIPKCSVCGKYCNFQLSKTYGNTCSKKCSNINIDYIEKRLKCNTYKNNHFVNIGNREYYILKCLELKFNINLEKQKQIYHYSIDGFYPKKNLIIEVNERYHLYNKRFQRDLRKYNFLLKRGYNILICWDNIKYYTRYQMEKLNKLKQMFPQIRHTFFNGGTNVQIMSIDGVWSNFMGIVKSKTPQSIIKICFDNDKELIGTTDHQLLLDNGKLTRLKDIKIGDLCNKSKVINIQHLSEKQYVYDPVEVYHKHLFKVDDFFITHQCLIIDEAAFIPNNLADEFFTSVYPTVSSSKDSQIIMVSTPNGQGNQFYKTWNKAVLKIDDEGAGGKVKWTPCRIDWWDVPGRDEHWKQIQLESYNGDIVKFNQEFGNCVGKNTLINVYDKILKRYFTTTIEQLYEKLKYQNYNNERTID